MERLSGKWRQVEHSARINGIVYNLTPAMAVEWNFGGEGIYTVSLGGMVVSVNQLMPHAEQNVLMVRPNSSKQAVPYSVDFRDDNTLIITIHRQSKDHITLLRA